MKLENVIPWGRDFAEYRAMFNLPRDTEARILGCGDGPASFNSEGTQRGWHITSADPYYAMPVPEMAQAIREARALVMPQVRSQPQQFIWHSVADADELERRRMTAMQQFLHDVGHDRGNDRYIAASLPTLPFADQAFDLALCSHLLFLYSDQLDEGFHIDSVLELCRVAQEARIYPLVSMPDNTRSVHLPAAIAAIAKSGYSCEEVPVAYRFQQGADTMLVVKKQAMP